jgi:hypothetical protein
LLLWPQQPQFRTTVRGGKCVKGRSDCAPNLSYFISQNPLSYDPKTADLAQNRTQAGQIHSDFPPFFFRSRTVPSYSPCPFLWLPKHCGALKTLR